MSLSTRATNSVVGSLVSDAATMGLHWIYDQNDIATKASGVASPAFFQPPSCPYYTYESGKLSPYGDELIPFLRSFADSKGIVKEDAATASYNFFKAYTGKPPSQMHIIQYAYSWVCSGRLNHVTKAFVENRDAGKPWDQCPIVDHQAQGIIKVPLTVARYAGHADLLSKVEDVVNVIHVSDISLTATKLLAIIQERILLSSDAPSEAIGWAAQPEQLASRRMTDDMKALITFITNDPLLVEYTQFATKIFRVPVAAPPERFKRMGLLSRVVANLLKSQSLADAVATLNEEDRATQADLLRQFEIRSDSSADVNPSDCTVNAVAAALGLSCSVPNALLTSLYIARKAFTYKEAVELNILAGGDNCSRSIAVGGLFAAVADTAVSRVPVDWIEKMNPEVIGEINALAERIVADNVVLTSA
jgi:ADP-ribosylglycohydrolase